MKAAQEEKRVSAAPGRVATTETVPTCKLEYCQPNGFSCFTGGKQAPGRGATLRLAMS